MNEIKFKANIKDVLALQSEVEAIPEIPTPVNTDEGKVLTVSVDSSGETPVVSYELETPSGGLPAISAGDAGKVLTVNENHTAAVWAAVPAELPAIGDSDAGKVLKVNAGHTGVEWGAASVVRTKNWTPDLELNSEYVELHQFSNVYQQGNIVTGCLALAAVSAFGQVGNIIILEGLPKAVNNINVFGISDQGDVVDFFINTNGQLKTAGYGSVSANDVLYMNVNYLAEPLREV